MTKTPLYDSWLAEQDDHVLTERKVIKAIPFGRLASPDDVAFAVIFWHPTTLATARGLRCQSMAAIPRNSGASETR